MSFVSALFAIALVSLAAFSLRALPVWIWPLLAVSLLGFGESPVARLFASPETLRPAPKTQVEACTQACEEQYGTGSHFFLTRKTCIDRCAAH